ncbi:MAG: class I SAM-dependent methyltransferase [Candidatus Latescibacteria bacterium]|nr:class I SAM-dependent methyltransferase [Candidatus Latescibacterota bacterium]
MSIEKASLYEKYRLPYADQAIPGLINQIGNIKTVADIGAGTGQVSRLFTDKCDQIYAIEPDESMRTVAQKALEEYSNITVINGSGEQTTLPDNSIDLIAIGNAFHRFKREACRELHRILTDTGWIVLISYTYLNKTFTDMLFSKLATVQSISQKSKEAWHKTPQQNLFGEGQIQTKKYPQSITIDWEVFWGAARAGIESPEKDEATFVQFEEINREVFDTFSDEGKMHIAYETTVSFGQPVYTPQEHTN